MLKRRGKIQLLGTINLMGKIIHMRVLFLFLSIWPYFTVSAQYEKSFATLNNKTVLSRLFDEVTYNSNQEALWKPNYSERINMPVSDDGFCHTVLDTTLYYTTENEEHAVLIFATYEYQNGERTSCHVCSPRISVATFIQEDNKSWSIEQFRKDFVGLGAWGEMLGQLSIEKLGEDFYCLKVQSAIDGNQGYMCSVTSYYSLNNYDYLSEVFSFVYYDSNEGAMEDGNGYTEKVKIRTIPSNESYYLIEENSQRTDRNVSVVRTFRYSEDDGRYIPL